MGFEEIVRNDMRKNYDEFEALKYFYLEDSFVLGFSVNESIVSIDIEAVLTEGHPGLQQPLPGEQYCYLKGRLVFEKFDQMSFEFHSTSRSRDANGDVDYGNIDSFVVVNNKSLLSGDWGKLEIDTVDFRFESAS
jgi:hypothetical protein